MCDCWAGLIQSILSRKMDCRVKIRHYVVSRQPFTCHDVILILGCFLLYSRVSALGSHCPSKKCCPTWPFLSPLADFLYFFIIVVSSWLSLVTPLSPLVFSTFFIQMDTSAQLSPLLKCLFMSCLQLSQWWRCLPWSWRWSLQHCPVSQLEFPCTGVNELFWTAIYLFCLHHLTWSFLGLCIQSQILLFPL